MERIQELIAKLNEQYQQNAGNQALLLTLQAIQFELTKNQESPTSIWGTAKVAVVMPKAAAHSISTPTVTEKKTVIAATEAPVLPPQPVREKKELALVEEDSVSLVQKNGQLDMVFDPLLEIPTLSQQETSKEILELKLDGESINDRLKETKTELVEFLKETPIKDLRKAIGINDRFLFINELFRGDETMYERSIKTINNFNIYAEAEYWINRELKIKLGWDGKEESVQLFDHLVKRRFS